MNALLDTIVIRKQVQDAVLFQLPTLFAAQESFRDQYRLLFCFAPCPCGSWSYPMHNALGVVEPLGHVFFVAPSSNVLLVPLMTFESMLNEEHTLNTLLLFELSEPWHEMREHKFRG